MKGQKIIKVIDAIKFFNQLTLTQTVLDYPGRPKVVVGIPRSGRERKNWCQSDAVWEDSTQRLWRWRRRTKSQGMQTVSRAIKSKEMILPYSLKKKHISADIPFFPADILISASVTCVRLPTSRNIR